MLESLLKFIEESPASLKTNKRRPFLVFTEASFVLNTTIKAGVTGGSSGSMEPLDFSEIGNGTT